MLMIQLIALLAIITILQTLPAMIVHLLFNIAINARMVHFALNVQVAVNLVWSMESIILLNLFIFNKMCPKLFRGLLLKSKCIGIFCHLPFLPVQL